ncbi:glycosyltransferase family 4 protein [Methanobacterium formicicum]|uniref:glycosyltransferase family 4 protein n=1 Tax=Methanobacterium formicicum TaxID=2162 RepID=UPI00249012E1|nr:glycosyltransferase family 4 protein [Methanobacterium formicicum]
MSDINDIGVINFPADLKSGHVPLSNLLMILNPLSKHLHVFCGNLDSVKVPENSIHYMIKHESGNNIFSRIVNYSITQVEISLKLLKIIDRDINWIFFIGGESLFLPMLILRLFRKKVYILIAGDPALVSQINRDPSYKLLHLLSELNLRLSTYLIVYSSLIVKQRNLDKYKEKIIIGSEHYVDFNNFKITKDYCDRDFYVGYLGHLSQLKGVMNFVESIPLIVTKKNKIKFLIGGEGPLKEKIDEYICKKKLEDRVELVGWLEREEIPSFLNKLKLIVIPSYTEGLPNVLIESMACGTPVLTTPVGAIKDIITDGYNGFIIQNNSPLYIAENIISILKNPKILEISKNSYNFIEKEYSYGNVLKKWENIFDNG